MEGVGGLAGAEVFLAGGMAGLLSDSLMHPVDTVRTRLWVQDKVAPELRYRSSLDAACKISRAEGLKAFYKGYGSVVLVTPVAYGVYFSTYEAAKHSIGKLSGAGTESPAVHFAAGIAANVTGQVAWTPMDVVKQRQQAVKDQPFKGLYDAFRTLYREGGVTNGLLRGYSAALYTYAPFSAAFFAIYEGWKVQVSKLHRSLAVSGATEARLAPLTNSAGGLVSGAVAAVLTAPTDAVKTRMQVGSQYNGKGFLLVAKDMWKQEGLRVFAQGISARVAWIAPGCAVTICTYEWFKSLVHSAVA